MNDFRSILAANGLAIDRPPSVEDLYDLPNTEGPLCEAMTADAGAGNSHIPCARPPHHEGDCEDLHGTLWTHEPDTGCCGDLDT